MKPPTVHADYSGPRKHEPRPLIPAVIEAARNLRFDEEDGWFWVPAEPGPLGPFDFAEACAAWMALSDMCDELSRKEISRLTALSAERLEMVHIAIERSDLLATENVKLAAHIHLLRNALRGIAVALKDGEPLNGKPLRMTPQEAVVSRDILIAHARATLLEAEEALSPPER